MGCDIHFHSEIKIGNEWHHYGHPSIQRNYALFGKMAGVRGDSEPISQPKGLPDDCSLVTALNAHKWDADGHSHSWLNAKEILELENWLSKQLRDGSWRLEMDYWGYLFGNSWGGFTEYPDEREPFLNDIRFVFWFDN